MTTLLPDYKANNIRCRQIAKTLITMSIGYIQRGVVFNRHLFVRCVRPFVCLSLTLMAAKRITRIVFTIQLMTSQPHQSIISQTNQAVILTVFTEVPIGLSTLIFELKSSTLSCDCYMDTLSRQLTATFHYDRSPLYSKCGASLCFFTRHIFSDIVQAHC